MANSRKSSYVDSSKEKLFWWNQITNRNSDILHIERAGITLPDPSYYICRTKNGLVYDYLYVLEYVVSGKGYIECEGRNAEVGHGDVYLINRKTTHTYYPDKKDPFTKKWLNISGTFMDQITKAFFFTEPFTVINIGKPAELVFDDIHEHIRLSSPADTGAAISYTMKRLLDIFILMDNKRREMSSLSEPIDRIVEYIEKNISLDITVSDICRNFYTSQSTIYRMFTKRFGISPKEFIQSKKIEMAKRMIASDSAPISYIASSLCFYDSHHFFRTFIKYTGMSPSDYRKSLVEKENP